MSRISLRSPAPADDEAVGAISFERYTTLGVAHERDVRDSLGHLQWREKDDRIVAVDGDVPIAYGWLRDWVDFGYLEMWVLETHRRRGAGALILDWALGAARARGLKLVMTTTVADDASAAFLRRHADEPSGGALRMALASDAREPMWPAGFTIRTEASKSPDFVDLVWRTDQAGFADNPGFTPLPRKNFEAVVERDDFELDLAWFAASDDGSDAGFCIASHVRDQSLGVIEDIAVLPAFRRRGLARALLRHAVAELRARGVGQVVLDTGITNERAHALYRSEGFETTHRLRTWRVPVA